jgi:HPt (histidine-containing phosphotransfer) domain-containing protein
MLRNPMTTNSITQTYSSENSDHNQIVDLDVLNAFEDLQDEGEPDLIVELIDLYLGDLPKRVAEIHQAITANEWIPTTRAAHRLKGSSANLGISRVAKVCERLEQIEQEELPQQATEILKLLNDEVSKASVILSAERKRRVA